MKIKIFTECGKNIGLGHVSRCASIYDEIIKRGLDVDFIVNADVSDVKFMQQIKAINQPWLNQDYLAENVYNQNYCIVDSYLATRDLYEVIAEKSQRAVYIDDTNRIDYPPGYVVNPSLNTGEMYKDMNSGRYLVGADYIILRKPFTSVGRKKCNNHVKEVLITIGGFDVRGLTSLILCELALKYKDIKFNVIVDNNATNTLGMSKERLDNVFEHKNLDAQSMKEVMMKSDLAVTAAGQTIYELIATKTPFIPIQVVDNQRYNIEGLKKINPNQPVLAYNESSFANSLVDLFETMLKVKKRKSLLTVYNNTIDGLGAQRIVDTLLTS